MSAVLEDAADLVVDATATTVEVVADVVDAGVDLMAPTERGRRRRRMVLLLVLAAVVAVALVRFRGDGDD